MRKAGPKSRKGKESSNGDDLPADEGHSDAEVANGAEDAGADSKSAKPKRANGTKSYKADDEDSDPDNGEKVQGDESDEESKESKGAKPIKKGGQKRKAAKAPKGKDKRKKVAAPESDDDQDEYEVDKVVEQKKKDGKRLFLIRWKGFGPKDDTWEAEDQLNCPEAIKLFLDAQASGDESEGEAEAPRDKRKKAPQKKAAEKKGKGKAKKPPAKKVLLEAVSSGSDADETEYDVDRILEVHFKKNGKREFLIRWKGFAKGDDTWEPEAHLNCTDLIKAFMEKVDKAKGSIDRELRLSPKHTNRYTLTTNDSGRRVSRRGGGKQRATYHDNE